MKMKENDNQQNRIVDRLDIQLLLAVIILFISAWAYLNNTICDFTHTEPYNERMSYILVHYILTSMLILCIGITYIKGRYLLQTSRNDFTKSERKYIDLFIEGWLPVLILCFLILTLSSFVAWYVWVVVFLFILSIYLIRKQFGFKEHLAIILSLLYFFPLFITAMTNISKKIDIVTSYNKQTESISIKVDAKSYDGRYFVVGLADKELLKDKHYSVRGPVITINRGFLRNNMVVVSTVCPASGSERFKYSIRKILGRDDNSVMPENASVYNKTQIISIDE